MLTRLNGRKLRRVYLIGLALILSTSGTIAQKHVPVSSDPNGGWPAVAKKQRHIVEKQDEKLIRDLKTPANRDHVRACQKMRDDELKTWIPELNGGHEPSGSQLGILWTECMEKHCWLIPAMSDPGWKGAEIDKFTRDRARELGCPGS